MENEGSNKSLISLVFVGAGFLVFTTVSIVFEAFAAAFGPIQKLHSQEIFRHGLPVGLGLITFAVLNFHPGIHIWADEVVTELRKVVWPSRKDTMAMTMVVCVMVTIAGVAFGMFDFVASQLMKMLVN